MKILTSTNPANPQQEIGKFSETTKEEITKIVENAKNAQSAWAETDINERASYIKKFANISQRRSKEIAKLITTEMGKPLQESEEEVAATIDDMLWLAEKAPEFLRPKVLKQTDKTKIVEYREPYGVSVAIAAWNFPFSNFKEAALQDLISGNTVIFKHSEETPACGSLISEIFDEIDIPEGVFTQVYGGKDVGEQLTDTNIDFISFIGSSKVGQHLYEKAANKLINVRLEMGGSSPGIVFDDVEINKVVDQIYQARFYNTGQVCSALKRLIVHEKIYPELINALKEKITKTDKIKLKNDEFSPLVAERQVEPLLKQIIDSVQQGAKLECGGKRLDRPGAFVESTLVTNIEPSMPVWNQETFGPVLPVMKFSTEDEAIELANDTEYGLNAYIFCENKERANRIARKIQAGQVQINENNLLDPLFPFGGYKKSGIGRTCGSAGLETCTQIKVIAEDL